MKEIQDIKRLLYPIVKGLPFILFVFISSVVLTSKLIRYKTPVYESEVRIKLDDSDAGVSNYNLFKDLDVFASTWEIRTEVEVLKSDILLNKVIKKFKPVFYYRVGKMLNSMVYKNKPFEFKYDSSNVNILDKDIFIKIIDDKQYIITFDNFSKECYFDLPIKIDEHIFEVKLNEEWFKVHKKEDFNGEYIIQVISQEKFMHDFIRGKFFVKELDKEMSIVKLMYEASDPYFASDFVNAVGQTYIEDYIDLKTKAASLTADFLEKRIIETEIKLTNAELELEKYRLDNHVLNIKQETETSLRQISELEIQLLNLQMKESTLDSLSVYITSDTEKFLDLAPSFEPYGGLLFTELIKKLKSLQSDRQDLLLKYTIDSEEVLGVKTKINDVVHYIVESIKNHRKSVQIQKNEILVVIKNAKFNLINYPTKEKELLILERNFNQNQELFNYLRKKNMEASIAQVANIAFHRVIQEGKIAEKPTSPNVNFSVGLAGFMSLLFSITLVYLNQFLRSKVMSRNQLEEMTNLEVLGIVKESTLSNSSTVYDLLLNMESRLALSDLKIITVTSSISNEGKSFVSYEMAKSMTESGSKILFVDLNYRNSIWQSLTNNSIDYGIEQISKDRNLTFYPTDLKNLDVIGFKNKDNNFNFFLNGRIEVFLNEIVASGNYDTIILDTPAFSFSSEVVKILSFSNLVLYVTRHNYTSTKYLTLLNEIEKIVKKEKLFLVLNHAPLALNYSGKFYGSRFMYKRPKGIKNLIIHYWKSYKNSWSI